MTLQEFVTQMQVELEADGEAAMNPVDEACDSFLDDMLEAITNDNQAPFTDAFNGIVTARNSHGNRLDDATHDVFFTQPPGYWWANRNENNIEALIEEHMPSDGIESAAGAAVASPEENSASDPVPAPPLAITPVAAVIEAGTEGAGDVVVIDSSTESTHGHGS